MGRRALLAFGGLATVAAVAASADIPSGPAGIVGAAFASRQPHTDSFPPAEDDSIWSRPMRLATGRVQGSSIRKKIEDGWNTKKDSIWCSEYIKKGILRAIDANSYWDMTATSNVVGKYFPAGRDRTGCTPARTRS